MRASHHCRFEIANSPLPSRAVGWWLRGPQFPGTRPKLPRCVSSSIIEFRFTLILFSYNRHPFLAEWSGMSSWSTVFAVGREPSLSRHREDSPKDPAYPPVRTRSSWAVYAEQRWFGGTCGFDSGYERVLTPSPLRKPKFRSPRSNHDRSLFRILVDRELRPFAAAWYRGRGTTAGISMALDRPGTSLRSPLVGLVGATDNRSRVTIPMTTVLLSWISSN